MKVSNLVSRSLRLLRVINANETPKAKDYETCIEALNGMVRRWEADGVSLGWSDVDNPGQDVPAPPEALEALAYNLAAKVRPEYGTELEPDVDYEARASYAKLCSDALIQNPLGFNRMGWGYNTYTDGAGYTVK